MTANQGRATDPTGNVNVGKSERSQISEVERLVPTLEQLADQTFFNNGSKDDMAASLMSLSAAWEKES